MTRKSSSKTTQRRSGGQSASSRTRGSSDENQNRQSASGQRSSSQSGNRSRSGNRGGSKQDDNQEWNFSQRQGAYGDSQAGEGRSFASRDYGHGRERPAYSSSSGSGRGFASMDPERRREVAARGGRASHGRAGNQDQDERRFTREIDSYYGRSRNEQDYRNREDFRDERGHGDERFGDREDFRGEGAYRSSGRGSDREDWQLNQRESGYDYGRSPRSDWRGGSDYEDRGPFSSGRHEDFSSGRYDQGGYRGDDYRRQEGYENEDNRSYQSSRGGGRFDQEQDDDRFYSGRGPRDREDAFSGSRGRSGSRSQSGSRSRSTSGRSRD